MKDGLQAGQADRYGSRPFLLGDGQEPYASSTSTPTSAAAARRRPRANSSSAVLATPTRLPPGGAGLDAGAEADADVDTDAAAAAAALALASPSNPGAGTAAATDSPGTWRHPRLDEITRRRRAATFSDRNIKLLLYYALHFVILWVLDTFVRDYLSQVSLLAPYIRQYWLLVISGLVVSRLYFVYVCVVPLFRIPDDISDIPLSPTQRKLLGLPPSSGAVSGATFNTPPRYSRTPSLAGSVESNRSLASKDSPLSGRASPLFFGGAHNNSSSRGALQGLGDSGNNNNKASVSESTLEGFSPSASPLFQRGLRAEARADALSPRRYSFGASTVSSASPSSNHALKPSLSSLFGEPLSPSPTSGKRTTVGLNNKWLYERGRRSSGTWVH